MHRHTGRTGCTWFRAAQACLLALLMAPSAQALALCPFKVCMPPPTAVLPDPMPKSTLSLLAPPGQPDETIVRSTIQLLDWSTLSFGPRLRLQADSRLDAERMLRQWRYGLGVGVDLPGAGELHATLYTRNNRIKEGPHYQLAAGDDVDAGDNRWSFGVYCAPVERMRGRDTVAVAPQLRLHLDRMFAWQGRAELTVEYAPWQALSGRGPDTAVPQIGLRIFGL